MSKPVKLRFTLSWSIDVMPHWYEDPNITPEKMAAFEQNENIEVLLGIGLNQKDFKFTVVPEEE